jgi:hypothetical protein
MVMITEFKMAKTIYYEILAGMLRPKGKTLEKKNLLGNRKSDFFPITKFLFPKNPIFPQKIGKIE